MMNRVLAYKFNDYWRDIGTAAAFYKASMEIVSQQARFSLNGSWPILTAEHISPPGKDFEKVNVVNSIVSPGCVVRGRVENSILSPGVWISDEAVVTNSVLMSKVFVGYHSIVNRCILDEQVNIGKFCYIGFRGNLLSGDQDTTVLGKGVVVSPYTAISHNCKILPYVGPADFITHMVPSGTIVSRQPVSENALVLEKLGANER